MRICGMNKAPQQQKTGECLGHPAGAFAQMGKTVYCDGSCVIPKPGRSHDEELSRTESACEQQKRDLGGNFTPDRIEANEDRWTDERLELMQIAYDREGLNEDGDPQ